jgi:cephalosporin-C deacetylase-like acetyl esterase
MAIREDVRFSVDGGIELGAWLYLPDNSGWRRPAITMAHGYAGTREHGIARFAEAFATTGFVVLLHDHRTFGVSGGERRQIADWRRAISYLQSRPEVDAARIEIWGTSYAGGHALALGATDKRFVCVVAQVPTISGYEQDCGASRPTAWLRLRLLSTTTREPRRGAKPHAGRRSSVRI